MRRDWDDKWLSVYYHRERWTFHDMKPARVFPPEVAIADWFYGKYVLLFDDVITRGRTMLRYKEILERKGAIVVGGFTLGKTKHERPIQGGMPNPSTQLFPPQSTTFSNNDFELPF
jgi:Predicted amidophosphoribosyltransferases